MSEELITGDKIGMSFNHGTVEHLVFGRVDSVRGIIPLLLPFGTYPTPPLVKDESRLAKIIQEMTTEFRDLWEEDTDDTISGKIREYLIGAIHCNPWDDVSSPGMNAFISKLIAAVAVDDLLDAMSDFSEQGIKYTEIDRIIEFCSGVFEGVYKTENEIPIFLPSTAAGAKLMWRGDRKLEAAIPDFHAKKGPLRAEWENCWNSFVLLMEKAPPGEEFSEQSLKIFTAHNGGGVILLETFALIRNVIISPEMRKEILLQNIIMDMASATQHINAMFGFPRDVRLNQAKDTPVLRLVTDQGVPLETAFNQVLQILCDEINDIRIGAKKLRDRFPKDENLNQFLRIIEHIIDGQVYGYGHSRRYGKLDMEVVKI